MRPLNIYISHAPEDKAMLDKLLKALYPLEKQYHLRIWYNTPVNPQIILDGPWKFVPFARLLTYRWRRKGWIINPDQSDRIAKAHIYLFLTSYKSLGASWIEDLEIIPATRRFIQYGERFVRIFPILLAPSLHKEKSRLSGFPILGPPTTIAKYPLEDEAWLEVCKQLEAHIKQMQANLIESAAIVQANAGAASSAEVQTLDGDAQFLSEEAHAEFGPPRIDLTKPVFVPHILAWSILFGLTALGYMLIAPRLFVRPYRPTRQEVVRSAESARRLDVHPREFAPVQITPTLPPPAPDTFPWPDRRGGPRIAPLRIDSSGLEFDN
ncbi:MAG: hypothetical protein ACK4NS_07375 [Saprospiraceae bacterium]